MATIIGIDKNLYLGEFYTVKVGHATLAMTMDSYAHVLPNTMAEEMKKLEVRFG